MTKSKIEEFLVKTEQKREKGWLYHLDKVGWLAKGRMGWIVGFDKNGKVIPVSYTHLTLPTKRIV